MEQVVLHPHVVHKNQEGYLRSKGSRPHTRLPCLGFQCQEDKSAEFPVGDSFLPDKTPEERQQPLSPF